MGRMIIVLALLGYAVSAAAGGIYKWVDENGGVHYDEHPPATGGAKELHLKDDTSNGIGLDAERAAQQERMLRAFDEEHAQQQADEQKAEQEQAVRTRNCARARDNLRRYQQASRIYDLDAQGNRRVLNDTEHAATLQRAQDDVKHWCS